VDDDRHPRQARRLGRPDRERVDVESARGEQPGDPAQHARLVPHEDPDRVQRPVAVAHTIGASAGSVVCSALSGPRMMSSFDAPAGTIGKTISLRSPRTSNTTPLSSPAHALPPTASPSSGLSARRPTAPYASASFT